MNNHCFNASGDHLNSSDGDSPLKLFTNAKQQLSEIFTDLNGFFDEFNVFIQGLDKITLPLLQESEKDLTDSQKKVAAILKVISRKNMKVAFFGRTSNGKSTVINSMLRDRILPSGLGHTTDCFLQIEGCDGDLSYFIAPDSSEPQNISDCNELSQALAAKELEPSQLVRILWPKSKCLFLKEDIVLIDSPGIDVSPDLDSWIDSHCMDADVFVLVSNAESVLTFTEKKFFIRVKQKLSSPYIFILNNRWDATAVEPENIEKVRKQHRDLEVEFLCNNLGVCTKEEVDYRIFFVSAKETLAKRTNTHAGGYVYGQEERDLEFDNFEKEFTSCLSKTAVRTKFKPHAEQGKQIIYNVKLLLDQLHQRTANFTKETEEKYLETAERADFIEEQLQLLTASVKSKIRHVTESVEQQVSRALQEEIRRLYNLIDNFEVPFHPDPQQLGWYKKELHHYVEQKLGENLSSRLGRALLSTLENVQEEIRAQIITMVPENRVPTINSVISRTDFSVAYRLNCINLCADFREDIAFKFSLAPASLFRRLMSSFSKGPSNIEARSLPAYGSLSFISNEGLLAAAQSLRILSSANSMILIAGGTLVWKGIGWRVILFVGSAYGLTYLYERLMWTKKAQERAFKKQYADFVSNKLKMIVDLTSGNASHQVQEELSLFFAQMCKHVDESKDELLDEMKRLDLERKKLIEINENTTKMRKIASSLLSKVVDFGKTFFEANF